jgi:O-antigen/teichoic acid export membrane protein
VIGVFFPAFAAMYTSDRLRTALMFDRATRFVLIVVFPVVLLFVAFAREFLQLWVGADFAAQSTTVLQVLSVGILINSFAQAPFALLQATRRADLTAKLHLVELPLYVLMILALGHSYGVNGVALAWTLRVSVDTVLLCWLNRRHLAELIPALDRSLVWLGVMIAILALIGLPAAFIPRAIMAASVMVVFTAFAWLVLLAPAERAVAREALRRRQDRPAPAQ